MYLLINIPDKSYKWICDHKGVTDFQTTQMLYNRIRKGKPVSNNILLEILDIENNISNETIERVE